MDRRAFLAGTGAIILVAPLAAEAQPPSKVPRIGVLTSNPMTAALQDAFRQGLRDHAYVEGQNILVEWRAADGLLSILRSARENGLKPVSQCRTGCDVRTIFRTGPSIAFTRRSPP